MLKKIRQTFKHYGKKREYEKWVRMGRPNPPPHVVKQEAVKSHAVRYNLKILVETGTYLGEMVDAVKDMFEQIHSIELSDALFKGAREKFQAYVHVTIHHGDSATVLPRILPQIDKPCLFWFDAHYSAGVTARGAKETPVVEELETIFRHPVKGHVILIDDARLFTGQNDYPSIHDVEVLVRDRYPGHAVTVKDDIIRIHAGLSGG